ncbi:MAG TPA: hypothetical protein VFS74_06205, partial [Gemmatimonadales bacterium]|nr:hypothetical protein [Gemmatimonadales bacterium]
PIVRPDANEEMNNELAARSSSSFAWLITLSWIWLAERRVPASGLSADSLSRFAGREAGGWLFIGREYQRTPAPDVPVVTAGAER